MGASYYKNEVARLLSVRHNSERAKRYFKDLTSTLKYLINEKNIKDKDIIDLYNLLQDNENKISTLNKYINESK